MNSRLFSDLASDIDAMGEKLLEIAIVSNIQESLMCIEKGYTHRASYANTIMNDKVGNKGDHIRQYIYIQRKTRNI